MNEIYQEGTLAIIDNDASNTLSTLSEVHSIISSNLYKEAQPLELTNILGAEHNKADYLKLQGLRDLAKMIWGNKSKIFTLALASQGAMGAALNSNVISTHVVSDNSLGNKSADLLPLYNNSNFLDINDKRENSLDKAYHPLYGRAADILELQTVNTDILDSSRSAEIITPKEPGDNWYAKFSSCNKAQLGGALLEMKSKLDLLDTDSTARNNSDISNDNGQVKQVSQAIIEHEEQCQDALRKEFDNRRVLEIANCALKIEHGKVTDAIKSFEDFRQLTDGMEDKELISGMINEAYNQLSYTDSLVDNIIEFISQLSEFSHRIIGYSALYEQMQDQQRLNDPMMIIINEQVKNTENMAQMPDADEEYKQEFITLKHKLEQQVNGVIDKWTSQIGTQEYSFITEFASKYPVFFQLHLAHLIKEAYAKDLNNIDKVVSFIKNLSMEHGVIACLSLFDVMKENNQLNHDQLLKLGHQVRAVTNLPNYHNISESEKERFEKLKDSLPAAESVGNTNNANAASLGFGVTSVILSNILLLILQ